MQPGRLWIVGVIHRKRGPAPRSPVTISAPALILSGMSAQNEQPQPTTTLGTPGEIIANIPGVLGFYPEESLIITTFFREGESSSHTLGPVLRINLDEADLLPDIADALEPVAPDLILAFIISGAPDSAEVAVLVDRLLDGAENGSLDVLACWTATGIFSGEPYHRVFGPPPRDLEDVAESPEWVSGRIPEVVRAAATRKMLEAGQLPEVNRNAAYSFFDRGNPRIDPEETALLQRRSSFFSRETIREVAETPGGFAYRSVLDSISDLLHDIAGKRDLDEQWVAGEADLLCEAASCLHTSLLRDSLIHFCAQRPQESMVLFLAVARTFDGLPRSNALCLYAIAALSAGLSARAVPAVAAALETTPGHNLSVLISQGLRAGKGRTIVEACLRGNELLRRRYDVDPEEDTARDAA